MKVLLATEGSGFSKLAIERCCEMFDESMNTEIRIISVAELAVMDPEREWNTKLLGFAFWAINIGLLMEILFSLLPIGLLQTYQSVSEGYWSARSPEFMQTSLMQTLRWMRLFGDTIFAIGAIAFVWFAISLIFTRKKELP